MEDSVLARGKQHKMRSGRRQAMSHRLHAEGLYSISNAVKSYQVFKKQETLTDWLIDWL